MSVVLSCFKIDDLGAIQYNPLNQRWHLRLRADSATRHLVIIWSKKLPYWCKDCQEEIQGLARTCEVCKEYSICRRCYMQEDHAPEHRFLGVSLDML